MALAALAGVLSTTSIARGLDRLDQPPGLDQPVVSTKARSPRCVVSTGSTTRGVVSTSSTTGCVVSTGPTTRGVVSTSSTTRGVVSTGSVGALGALLAS